MTSTGGWPGRWTPSRAHLLPEVGGGLRAGALVLSEFTGAALELREATTCNPFDVEGLSLRIEQALQQSERTRRRAMGAMARRVHTHDVHRWVEGQLDAIAGVAPAAAPPP